MKKIGRNDPCPCGSGKKYKRCCLEKDQAKSPQPSSPETDSPCPVLSEPPRKENQHQVSAQENKWSRFWRDLEQAGVEEKLRMVSEVVENEPDFDGELAFELVESICRPLREADRVKDLNRIIKRIEELHPLAYSEESGWMNLYLAENALLEPEGDLLTPLSALAENPEDNIEQLFQIIYRLLYHGRASELDRILSRAWPKVKIAEDITVSGIEEFQEIYFYSTLFQFLDKDPNLDPEDPAFNQSISPIWEGTKEWLRLLVLHSSGRAERTWKTEDFQNQEETKLAINLFLLTLDFSRFLHSQRGWNRLKSELARTQIYDYILPDRAGKKKKSPRLLPEAQSADKFLVDRVQIFAPRPYQASAFCQALPLWIGFISELKLAAPESFASRWENIKQRLAPLPRLVNGYIYDPVMLADLQACL